MENLFVLLVGMASGGFIFRRIHRMGVAHKRKAPACGSCASGTCAPVKGAQTSERGETPLPLR